MKQISLFVFLLFLTTCLFAQKRGYEEIQINSKLSAISFSKKYRITPDTAKNTWRIDSDSLTIFSAIIDHMKVQVDDEGTIKRINVFTKPATFNDYNERLSDMNYVVNYINATVGKKNSNNVGRGFYDFTLAWSFKDTKTALLLHAPDIDTFIYNFKYRYELTWIEDKNNWADQKYKTR